MRITYTIKQYIEFYMLIKKHITLKTKIIYHQCVIDVGNTMKQLFMFSTTVGIEKKYRTYFNPY